MVFRFNPWKKRDGVDTAVDPQGLLKRSRVFCMAPWSHIHVLPDGKIYACCMSAHSEKNALGDLHKGDSLEKAWNSRKMRGIRRSMLSGKRTSLCERCYIAEENKQHSFRNSVNYEMAHHVDAVKKTARDGRLREFKVPYLDIRLSNLCNYRCRICCAGLSSAWRDDALKLGWIDDSMPKVLNAGEGNNEFMSSVIDLVDDVERIFFAGGEPLIMDEHYEILDRLMKKEKWNTHIAYNTNCSVIRYKRYDLLEMWKKFKDVFILASLDGSHERGDYMRKGQEWDTVEQNILEIKKECPHVRFRLSPTVSLFNAFHMIDFYKELHEKGLIGIDDIGTNILLEPAMYNIRNFPPHLKSELTERYKDFIAVYLDTHKALEETKNHFRAVVNYMNGDTLKDLWKFKWVTSRLDELRDESFSEIFPEIRELAD